MSRLIRYGCIGAGGIARKKHLPGYQKLHEVELVAVCDVNIANAQKLADEFGVPKVYTDYREMITAEKLDLVSICTPNNTHTDIAIDAMGLGCHVHVEKPMALHAIQAARIAAAERQYGKYVMVGLDKRYQSESILVERLMKDGFFGEIYQVRCGWERSSGIPGSGAWFTNQALSGGGALIDLGVHYLDWAMSILDYPEPVSIVGSSHNWFLRQGGRIRRGYRSNPNGICNVEDFATGTIKMSTGTILDFTFSWASNIQEEVQYLEIFGRNAGMTLRNGKLMLFREICGVMFSLVPDMATMPEAEDEFAHFVSCIQKDVPTKTCAQRSLQTMRMIDQIYAAIS